MDLNDPNALPFPRVAEGPHRWEFPQMICWRCGKTMSEVEDTGAKCWRVVGPEDLR